MFQCSAMIVFILSVAALIPYVILETCFYEQCMGCSPERAKSYEPVECRFTESWVDLLWLVMPENEIKWNTPYPGTPVEYRCLKMLATPNDKSKFGNIQDVICGCVPSEDSLCKDLVMAEKQEGHSDAQCFICKGDNCNTATLPLHATITTLLLYFILG